MKEIDNSAEPTCNASSKDSVSVSDSLSRLIVDTLIGRPCWLREVLIISSSAVFIVTLIEGERISREMLTSPAKVKSVKLGARVIR